MAFEKNSLFAQTSAVKIKHPNNKILSVEPPEIKSSSTKPSEINTSITKPLTSVQQDENAASSRRRRHLSWLGLN